MKHFLNNLQPLASSGVLFVSVLGWSSALRKKPPALYRHWPTYRELVPAYSMQYDLGFLWTFSLWEYL